MIVCITFTGCSKNELTSISATQMPDVEYGEIQKGFTCTGLVYDKNEDVFYIGNIGKDLPTTEGFKSTIVKVSKDFTENLGEIKLYEIFKDMDDIQGLTIDYSDDSFWFCSFAENKIRCVSKDGEDIESIDYDKPIGITYDNRTDSLWVLSNESLNNISKKGDIIKSIEVQIEGQDQLWLDEESNKMYFTAGNNYKGKNYVYTVDLNTDKVTKIYTLKDSYAVEGIYISKNEMYILNDGYYHNGKVAVNQVNKYDISR